MRCDVYLDEHNRVRMAIDVRKGESASICLYHLGFVQQGWTWTQDELLTGKDHVTGRSIDEPGL